MVNSCGYSLGNHSALTFQFNTIAFHSISYQTAKYLLEKAYIHVLYMFVPRIAKMGKQKGEVY